MLWKSSVEHLKIFIEKVFILMWLKHFKTERLFLKPKKTADISRRDHWFSHGMTFVERAQKFHTDDVSLTRSG